MALRSFCSALLGLRSGEDRQMVQGRAVTVLIKPLIVSRFRREGVRMLYGYKLLVQVVHRQALVATCSSGCSRLLEHLRNISQQKVSA